MIKENIKFSNSLIFEGMTSISAVINSSDNNDRKIIKIIYDKAKEKSKAKELGFLKYKAKELDFEIEAVDACKIEENTIGNSHGGIIAFCTERTIPFLESSLDKIKPGGFYIMLEGIEDPYNFGNALRSLYAFGADGIILNERNWMGAAGVVSRSSAGASEKLDMFTASGETAVKVLKSLKYTVACAGIRNSVSVYEGNLKKPLFLIIGGEKRGISSSVLNLSDEILRIDYNSNFKGSLSAAASAAVIGYEVMRQNKSK